jgi:hypothetical protein
MYEFKIMMFVCDRFEKLKKTSSNHKKLGQFKNNCGFLLDEVINPTREYYADHRVNVGLFDENRDNDEEEE